MKCPHCEMEIPGSPCPECGETVLEGANYCMDCGAPLNEEMERVFRDEDDPEDDAGFDFEDRILCPDGSCTGIIVDGKCTECGKTPEDKEPQEDDEGDPSDDDKGEDESKG